MEHASVAATTMPVKLSLSGSKRRLRLDVPLKFVQLCQKVRVTFPDVKTFKLEYVDEEGDKIAVDSDADLEEARTVFQSLGRIPTFVVNKTAASTVDPTFQKARRRCAHNCRPMARLVRHFRHFPLTFHYGVTCDGSKQHPLVGKRFHKIGHNYDLNETEFRKLPRHEQLKYEVIAVPGATPVPLAADDVVHPGITCDVSNQSPLVGKRYHKIGHNYDLNETEFQKLSSREKLKYEVIDFPGATPVRVTTEFGSNNVQIIHPGITCDGSKQCPLVGKRYHKIGHDYDLNEAEFKKLPSDEQQKYELIAFPGARPVPVVAVGDCVFVRDVTVPDNEIIPCGKQFKKVWLVKTGAAGWPAGCTLTHVAGDKMGTLSGCIRLEAQKAHALVELSVTFVAPTGNGKTTSKWRIAGPDGKFFGHTLWVTIITHPADKREEPESAPVSVTCPAVATTPLPAAPPLPDAPVTSSPLQQLLEMGFAFDVEKLQRVLDDVNGNVSAAVNTLFSMD